MPDETVSVNDVLGAQLSSQRDISLATLVHISDLHFNNHLTTDESGFKEALSAVPYVSSIFGHSYQAAESLSACINRILQDRRNRTIPTCVVLSGDLTKNGRELQLMCGTTYLRSAHFTGVPVGLALGEDKPIINEQNSPGLFMVHGNHDIWHRRNPKGLGAYRRYFNVSFPVRCEIHTAQGKVIIYGLDTTTSAPWAHRLARGEVAGPDLSRLIAIIERDAKPDVVQIVCMHHPLTDGPYDFNQTMRLDGREAIAASLEKAGVSLVLSGHVHQHYCVERVPSQMPSQIVAASGTQQFESRSFALVDIFPEYFRVIRYAQSAQTRQFEPVRTAVAYLPRSLPVNVDALP